MLPSPLRQVAMKSNGEPHMSRKSKRNGSSKTVTVPADASPEPDNDLERDMAEEAPTEDIPAETEQAADAPPTEPAIEEQEPDRTEELVARIVELEHELGEAKAVENRLRQELSNAEANFDPEACVSATVVLKHEITLGAGERQPNTVLGTMQCAPEIELHELINGIRNPQHVEIKGA